MARTRSQTLYPQKRARLLEVAQRMFVRDGYEGTAMSKLAVEAEVAPNTLYWYFADKDALLVEVLNATVLSMFQQFMTRLEDPLDVQMLWLAGVLEDMRSLVATVHTRAAHSPVLATWHHQFHAFLEAQFIAQMHKRGVPEGKLRPSARIGTFVLEGMLSHACTQAEREEIVKTLVEALSVSS